MLFRRGYWSFVAQFIVSFHKQAKCFKIFDKISSLLFSYERLEVITLREIINSDTFVKWVTLFNWDSQYFWFNKWIVTLVPYTKFVPCCISYHLLKFVQYLFIDPVSCTQHNIYQRLTLYFIKFRVYWHV